MSKHYDLIIRNAKAVTSSGIVAAHVAIQDGRFAKIGENDATADRVIDAKGRWVMPGGVDPHAHIEQMSGMGLMNADTFETATKSALFGGTTTVVSFAAQSPGQNLSEAVADYAVRAKRGAMADYAFHLIVSDLSVPDFEADFISAIDRGHRSIKLFTTYNIGLDDSQILNVLELAKQRGALVCIHAENDAIIAARRTELIAAGQVTPRDHARARPRLAEIEAVARMCRFAEYTGQPVMLFHISTREAVDEVRAARARGAPVLAETCPHYLFMTEGVLDRPHGAKWMCSPPQREPDDQEALWGGLLDGTLQLVSSDHAPYRYDASGKLLAGTNAPFHKIANGMPGLETRLPLMFDAMVSQGRGGPEVFARLSATAPAELHGLKRKGRIEVGYDADCVIWDDDRLVTYGENDLHDNVGYNPWEGMTVKGWPETVLLRGEVVCDAGLFSGTAGLGRWQNRPSAGGIE